MKRLLDSPVARSTALALMVTTYFGCVFIGAAHAQAPDAGMSTMLPPASDGAGANVLTTFEQLAHAIHGGEWWVVVAIVCGGLAMALHIVIVRKPSWVPGGVGAFLSSVPGGVVVTTITSLAAAIPTGIAANVTGPQMWALVGKVLFVSVGGYLTARFKSPEPESQAVIGKSVSVSPATGVGS